jgi:hypothetical protein
MTQYLNTNNANIDPNHVDEQEPGRTPSSFRELQIVDSKIVNRFKKIAQRTSFDLLKVLDHTESNKWRDNQYVGHQVATAESLTAGLIMSTLVDIPWAGYLKYGCFWSL